jgi:lipoprotein Spr
MNVIRTAILLLSAGFVVSCGALKPAANPQITNNLAAESSSELHPKFLEVKTINPQKITANHATSGLQSFTPVKVNYATETNTGIGGNSNNTGNLSQLQIKFGMLLDVPAESIQNKSLYEFIEDWYGTRYRFGGTSRSGIDCSSLMQKIYSHAFGMEIPRTAVTQYRASRRIVQEELQEGDLIFFHTTRPGISHVGLYLGNRHFVHASSSRGVVISNLDEKYYQNAYRGSGRFDADFKYTDN